ncbi:hypothetical protein BDK51DRAFT_30989, partial [Blyttiomyces helicus]
MPIAPENARPKADDRDRKTHTELHIQMITTGPDPPSPMPPHTPAGGGRYTSTNLNRSFKNTGTPDRAKTGHGPGGMVRLGAPTRPRLQSTYSAAPAPVDLPSLRAESAGHDSSSGTPLLPSGWASPSQSAPASSSAADTPATATGNSSLSVPPAAARGISPEGDAAAADVEAGSSPASISGKTAPRTWATRKAVDPASLALSSSPDYPTAAEAMRLRADKHHQPAHLPSSGSSDDRGAVTSSGAVRTSPPRSGQPSAGGSSQDARMVSDSSQVAGTKSSDRHYDHEWAEELEEDMDYSKLPEFGDLTPVIPVATGEKSPIPSSTPAATAAPASMADEKQQAPPAKPRAWTPEFHAAEREKEAERERGREHSRDQPWGHRDPGAGIGQEPPSSGAWRNGRRPSASDREREDRNQFFTDHPPAVLQRPAANAAAYRKPVIPRPEIASHDPMTDPTRPPHMTRRRPKVRLPVRTRVRMREPSTIAPFRDKTNAEQVPLLTGARKTNAAFTLTWMTVGPAREMLSTTSIRREGSLAALMTGLPRAGSTRAVRTAEDRARRQTIDHRPPSAASSHWDEHHRDPRFDRRGSRDSVGHPVRVPPPHAQQPSQRFEDGRPGPRPGQDAHPLRPPGPYRDERNDRPLHGPVGKETAPVRDIDHIPWRRAVPVAEPAPAGVASNAGATPAVLVASAPAKPSVPVPSKIAKPPVPDPVPAPGQPPARPALVPDTTRVRSILQNNSRHPAVAPSPKPAPAPTSSEQKDPSRATLNSLVKDIGEGVSPAAASGSRPTASAPLQPAARGAATSNDVTPSESSASS